MEGGGPFTLKVGERIVTEISVTEILCFVIGEIVGALIAVRNNY